MHWHSQYMRGRFPKTRICSSAFHHGNADFRRKETRFLPLKRKIHFAFRREDSEKSKSFRRNAIWNLRFGGKILIFSESFRRNAKFILRFGGAKTCFSHHFCVSEEANAFPSSEMQNSILRFRGRKCVFLFRNAKLILRFRGKILKNSESFRRNVAFPCWNGDKTMRVFGNRPRIYWERHCAQIIVLSRWPKDCLFNISAFCWRPGLAPQRKEEQKNRRKEEQKNRRTEEQKNRRKDKLKLNAKLSSSTQLH